MRRARLAAATAGLLLVATAPAALAVEAVDVADQLRTATFFRESGAERVDEQELDSALTNAQANVRAVILADEPEGGEEAFAETVLQELGQSGTIIVISPTAIQVVSSEASNGEVNEALAATEDAVDIDEAGAGEIAVAFAEAFDEVSEGGAAGSNRLPVVLGVVGGGALLLGGISYASSRRRRKRQRQQEQQLLDEARQEVGSQIALIGEQIVGLTDRVAVAGNSEISGLFNDAAAAYTKAQQQVEWSKSAAELERVSDELDHTRWQLEAVAARLDGRDPPPRPAGEAACFFDPTHGAGTVEVQIDIGGGTREVRVCANCATKLEAGEVPQPRMIMVGGHQVPAPMAPRPYGGGGLGWLGDFAIILGGHRQHYGWGGYSGWGGYRPPRRRGSWGTGGWGAGWDGGSRRSSGWGWGGGTSRSTGGSGWSSGRRARPASSGFGGAGRSRGSGRGRGRRGR